MGQEGGGEEEEEGGEGGNGDGGRGEIIHTSMAVVGDRAGRGGG